MSNPGAPARRSLVLIGGMYASHVEKITGWLLRQGARVPGSNIDNDGFALDARLETVEIAAALETFLLSVGSAWIDARPLPNSVFQSAAAEQCRHQLIDIFQREPWAEAPLVVGDPKTCRLMPIWRDVAARLGLTPFIIIPFRDPAAVVSDLRHSVNLPDFFASTAWLTHMLWCERDTRGLRRIFVDADAWPMESRRLQRVLEDTPIGLMSPREEPGPWEEWQSDPTWRSATTPPSHDPRCSAEIVRDTYRWLCAASRDRSPPLGEIDEIAQTLIGALELFDFYLGPRLTPVVQ